MSEKQFSEKPWGSVGVRKYGPKNPKAVLPRNRRSENLVRKAVFEEARRVLLQPARKAIFGEAEDGPKTLVPKSCFSERPSWSETMFSKGVRKSNFRRNRRSENLVRKAVFEEARRVLLQTCPKKQFFGEAEDGPKPWSEELFFGEGQAGPKLFPKVSEKQFSEKPEVRKIWSEKAVFRRSQGGPKTCPKSNFRRSRGWSQSYPEMCTENKIFREAGKVWKAIPFSEKTGWSEKLWKMGEVTVVPWKPILRKAPQNHILRERNIIMFIPCMWKFGAKYIGCKGQQHVKFNKRACMDAFASCRAFHEPEHAALYSATSFRIPNHSWSKLGFKSDHCRKPAVWDMSAATGPKVLENMSTKSASSQVSFNGNAMNNSRSVRSAGITGFSPAWYMHGKLILIEHACMYMNGAHVNGLYSPERSNGLHVGFSPNAKKALPKSWRIGS